MRRYFSRKVGAIISLVFHKVRIQISTDQLSSPRPIFRLGIGVDTVILPAALIAIFYGETKCLKSKIWKETPMA